MFSCFDNLVFVELSSLKLKKLDLGWTCERHSLTTIMRRIKPQRYHGCFLEEIAQECAEGERAFFCGRSPWFCWEAGWDRLSRSSVSVKCHYWEDQRNVQGNHIITSKISLPSLSILFKEMVSLIIDQEPTFWS